MEKQFEKKLNLEEENNFEEFDFADYQVLTKISTNDVKIVLPEQIIEYISNEKYFTQSDADSLLWDKEKLCVFKEGLKNKVIDLRENDFIQDNVILKALLACLGSINARNDFTQMTSDDYLSNIEIDHFIDTNPERGYCRYIERNLEIIFGKFKMKDLATFVKAARTIGINFDFQFQETLGKEGEVRYSDNVLFNKIKTFVMRRNKILVVMTPSNNFWIKSDKLSLGTKNYDKRLNNYTLIYYNWPFIQKFYDRIANHPRCLVGFLNSMIGKNLKPTVDCIPIQVKNFTSYILFDQNSHENSNPESNGKPNFIRNIEKMVSICKSYEGANFNETNILILESEKDKVGNTKANMIPMNIFSEEYFTFSPEEVKKFELQIEATFCYIERMLNECECDVREYLAINPLN